MCTDMILPFCSENPLVVSGRNTDLSPSPDVDYLLYKIPQGTDFKGYAPKQNPGYLWSNCYGYVGIAINFKSKGTTPAQEQAFLEGFNEKGLSAASLALPYSNFEHHPSESEYDKCVDANLALQLILGTCATVDDVQKKLDELVIWFPKAMQPFDSFHFSIHDKQGKSLVVEFINEQKIYYNNGIGALANEPTFDWHTINFNYFYKALTNADNNVDRYVKMTKDADGRLNPTVGTGYQFEVLGNGMFGLPGDSSSPSRFIRAAKLREFVPPPTTGREGAQYAVQVLSRVAVVEHEVQLYYDSMGKPYDPRDTYDITLWSAIRDHTNGIFYYYTTQNHNLKAVDLNELNFAPGSGITQTGILSDDWYENATSSLQPK